MSGPTFEVLYESGPVLVVYKPAGLLTQAPAAIDSLERQLKDWIREREKKTGNVYLGIPHRLDRPVSGAIVFARNSRAAKRIAQQFEDRLVEKTYWACVEGHVTPNSGTWTDCLWKVHGEPRAEVVAPEHPQGRQAVLHYRVVGETEQGSVLSIELETGRTHQIRVQASSRGHAVLGDELYGSRISVGPTQEDPRLRPIALHARSLAFLHPMTQERVAVEAALPAYWPSLTLAASRPD